MRIVITGAGGFIGRHLLRRLEARNDFSILVHGKDATQARNAKSFQGDVTERQSLAGLCEGAELAIHLAYSFEGTPEKLVEVNAKGTANFLDECVAARVPRFILFSSGAVYGAAGERAPDEKSELKPDTPYGKAKRMAEEEVEKRVRAGKINATILRLTNVYGPGGRGVLNKYVDAIAKGEEIVLQGDGTQERDFLYVEDLVGAIEKVVDRVQKENMEVLNISGNGKITLNELIALIEKVLGKKARIRREPERPGSVKCLWADSSRARKLLKWQPKIGLQEGILLTSTKH
jgi:nucleoside-diphosphate-sugar epimerase